MMRNLDLSSWEGVLSTVFGLLLVSLLMVGVRLLVMETVQQRRNRENRQINERLRTLIAAYKVLGGSFTGDLAVDPTHLRDVLRRQAQRMATGGDAVASLPTADGPAGEPPPGSSDRGRRIRDAVEAALSDIILLGTEGQVRLAAQAAADLAAGRPVHTDRLVVSLRDFIRQVLDLDPVPPTLAIPRQGPARVPVGSGGGNRRGGSERGDGADGSKGGGGGRDGGVIGGGLGLGLGVRGGTLDGTTPGERE